jgi:hypothetical protein
MNTEILPMKYVIVVALSMDLMILIRDIPSKNTEITGLKKERNGLVLKENQITGITTLKLKI